MMMKNIVILLIILSFMSCSTNKSITGVYWSSQSLGPLGPDKIIYFQDDSTYIKINSASFGRYIEGKWTNEGDTLFLEDIFYVTKNKRELIVDDELEELFDFDISNIYVYIRQGKVWCYIDDIDKPKKRRYVLKKDKRTKKEDVLKWPFRYD